MNFLFLFASLGVVNGVFVGVYLLFKKDRKVSDVYFAGLILTLCIRIGKSVLYYFFPETDRIVLQIGLSGCVFIGPFFYLYIKSLQHRQKSFKKRDAQLLLSLLISISIIGLIYPYRVYPQHWNPEIVQGIYLIWGLFTILGAIQAYKLLGHRMFSFWKMKGEQQYLMMILVGVVFITLTYQLALYIGFTYLWGAFIFSILFYVLAFRAFSKGKSIAPKPIAKKLFGGDQMLNRINEFMKKEKLYTNQELKLEDIANGTNLTRHEVSQVLNEVYEHGYLNYIKELRINEAKALITSRSELSLEGIGYEAGFKSKSVFFESFKKIVGSTPAAYKKRFE
ncbi:helix-turn-helix domain-containing protein [Ekhidna sp.]